VPAGSVLGTFGGMDLGKGDLYIGRDLDSDEPVVYQADDLTTHGVIVGMTGSGKTGLGVDLIEEALLNGISCLVIDPKGDMGNLALTFPDLALGDFSPWVDEATARKEGKTREELAEATAALWKTGLEGHGIGPERIRRLQESADITIYTPGSSAGVGIDVIGSLDAPDLDWDTDGEVLRDEISSFVSSLLVLAGITSDPVSGKEHILLATIIEHSWREGHDLDLAKLVGQVPNPPFRKLGVFEVDTFFPEKDRMTLAMKLNGLLASPSFQSWMHGKPLDIEAMIGGDRPRAAIVYLTHLSDEERQFLVTLLLSKMVTWIRSQPGTSELRALIYMDEVFGFAPPTREPPSKRPILTILKQARAHGVGMVLSTQNPVDLDYKAMANAGTWLIGRLQTENDKRRILEGLASASGKVDVGLIDKQITDLEKREFVLHSTNRATPLIFGTRWAMSYLAGPLTRDQVRVLMEDQRTELPDPAHLADGDDGAPDTGAGLDSTPPPVAEGVRVSYLDPAAPWAHRLGVDPAGTVHEPAIAATVQLLYDETKAEINHRETYEAVVFPLDGVVDIDDIISVDHDERDFVDRAPNGATYRVPDLPIAMKTFWRSVETDLKDYLMAHRPLSIFANPDLGIYSRVDESEEEFRERCREAAEQAADAEVAKLEKSLGAKMDRVRKEMGQAQARFREADAVAAAKSEETLLGTAGDLLGAFLGGRSGSTVLGKAARRRAAAAKAGAKAETEEAKYHAKHAELAELEEELAESVETIVAKHQEQAESIEEFEVPLERDDIKVTEVGLVWVPVE
jgi:hypothetical protein